MQNKQEITNIFWKEINSINHQTVLKTNKQKYVGHGEMTNQSRALSALSEDWVGVPAQQGISCLAATIVLRQPNIHTDRTIFPLENK